MLCVGLGGLAYVLVDAHSKSRKQLQESFYERPAVAAALFSSLLQGVVTDSSVPTGLSGSKIKPAALAAEGPGSQRVAVYTADGRLLAWLRGVRSAPVPTLAEERSLVKLALARGTAISDVLGSPPNSSVELGTRFGSGPRQRVEVVEFALPEISALLPAYMTAMAERGGKAFILDSNDRVIGSSIAAVVPGSVSPDTSLSRALDHRPRGAYSESGGAWHFTSGSIPATGWHVVLAIRDSVLFAAVSGADQSLSWILFGLFAICGGGALVLFARSRRDSARLARANSELELRNAQVVEANQAKSRFLASMSHELRTPLNGIIGFAELMHDGRVGEVSEQHREYLADILSSAQHLLALINDVLDISKVEAGKLEFHPELVDVGAIVTEVRAGLRTLAHEKRIALSADVDHRLGTAWLDPAKLRQVLFNYVSNAIKFTPTGGKVWIKVALGADDMLSIEVRDTGTGIAPDDLPKLWAEFGRLERANRRAVPGTGLGLALTKRLVEAQGGSVGVQSVIGKGSVFTANIPLVNPERLTATGVARAAREPVLASDGRVR